MRPGRPLTPGGRVPLVLALAALAALAGPVPAQDAADELGGEYRISVLDDLRRVRGFVPADVKAVWSRFLDQIESARASVGHADAGKSVPGDLGDGFLTAWSEHRGLGRKLDALAGYRTALGRARRWVVKLEPRLAEALVPGIDSLSAEVGQAEGILVRQLGEDLGRGGQGLGFVTGHVQRAGLAGATAQDAFGGLVKGLKQELTRLSADGRIRQEAHEAAAQEIGRLDTLLSEP